MKKKIFNENEEKIIRELYATGKYNRLELAQFFPGRTPQQCVNYLHTRGIVLEKHIFWSPEEDEILKKLCAEGIVKFKDMHKFFNNRSPHSVTNRAVKLGIGSNFSNKKYFFNENYFDELTLENIYFAGMIAADGCLRKMGNDFVFSWALAEKDLEHLQLFREKSQSTHKISTYKSASPSHPDRINNYYRLVICRAVRWTEKLKEHFGIIPKKTKRFPPPKLNNNIQKFAFIKGLLDGDGSITTCGSNKNGGISIGICSCNKEILLWIKDFFDNINIPVISQKPVSNITIKSNENCYYYYVTGFRAAILHEIFIRIKTPYLKRKWENPVVLELKKYWEPNPEWPNELFFQNILNG